MRDVPKPGEGGVTWRLVTHNLWGVSVKDPLTRPVNSAKLMMELAQAEGWTNEPYVMGMQEVYSFRLDPVSFYFCKGLMRAEHAVHGVAPIVLYLLSFFTHLLVVLFNALVCYAVNPWRYHTFGHRIFDIKRLVLPVLHDNASDTPTIMGYCNEAKVSTTFGPDMRVAGDAGTLLMFGGGLQSKSASHGFEGYRGSNGTELCCNKGVQWVVFAQQKTCVLNTHMQALDDPFRMVMGGLTAQKAYDQQVQQIKTLITTLEQEHQLDYIFLLGDLNTMRFSVQQVQETFGMFKLTLDGDTHVDGCVDHVLCNRKFLPEQLRSRHIKTPSDHLMVVLEVRG